jgi:two-component system OmpR family sensor kinase
MALSLRARLVAGLVLLVLGGLAVANVLTYVELRGFLADRVDSQLVDASHQAVGYFTGGGPGRELHPGGPDRGGPPGIPSGTYEALALSNGTVLSVVPIGYGQTASSERPSLPTPLSDVPAGLPRDAQSSTGSTQYRLMVTPVGGAPTAYVVVAIPIDQGTLTYFAVLEASIGAAVLALMVLLGLLIVRIGLRPLGRMGETASAIARGDLSRRVSPATPRTEIGRLGLALNGMLSQIESAFAERTQSEWRLRRFIADASHELRTPLTSIRGYAELLRRGAQRSPDDAELARRRIEEEAIRMGVLVDDMLLLARLNQGRPLERGPVDLWAIARDARADASAVAPARAVTLSAAEPLVVTGDDMRLRQVVGNLVRNALVHTPPHTPVEIDLARRDGRAVLTVVDHGPGLPPDVGARIFEPFYRGDPGRSRDRGGSGLGLSIVAAVVAAHHGDVRVTESPGGGATFAVELPLGEAPAHSANSQPAPRHG